MERGEERTLTIYCDTCAGLVGRNPECDTCRSSERKVAFAEEFMSPGSKTTLGLTLMQAWQNSGGEVVFTTLEVVPSWEQP